MTIQDLLAATSGEKVDAFLTLARESLDDQDQTMVSLMLEEGMTPWQSAVRASEIYGVSVHTLFRRCLTLVKEIHHHLGRSIEEWAAQLAEDGEVENVPSQLIGDVRKLMTESGYVVESVVCLRVLSRPVVSSSRKRREE